MLHATEALPVHAIGLPSLLSDVGARCPEEALVHAMAEARRTSPAVLYLPHLQVCTGALPLFKHVPCFKPYISCALLHT